MKLYFLMAVRNLMRNPLRSLISCGGIAGSVFLCAFLANLQRGSYQQLLKNGVEGGPGHIVLMHPDYPKRREVEQFFPEDEVHQALANMNQEVSSLSLRLYIPGLAQSPRGGEGIVLLGTNIEEEFKRHPLLKPQNLVAGQYTDLRPHREALIGTILGKRLGLALGKKFVVTIQDSSGETRSLLLRVRGILDTGLTELDAATVLVPLDTARQLLGEENALHEAAILLKHPQKIDSILLAMRSVSGLVSHAYHWEEALPQLMAMIRLDRANSLVIASFLMIIVGLGCVNSLMMSIMERRREFGVLRALGLQKPQVVIMVLCEGVVLALAGCLIGLMFAISLSAWTNVHGIDFSSIAPKIEAAKVLVDPVIYTAWDWSATQFICMFMVSLGLMASVYPAYLATSVPPSEAMK